MGYRYSHRLTEITAGVLDSSVPTPDSGILGKYDSGLVFAFFSREVNQRRFMTDEAII